MAKREFGGTGQVKDWCRDERRWAWMSGIRQDLVFALRQMRRSPGFGLTAVLTLALGIAADVIVFGVLQAMILRPLDVPHGERVMTLAHSELAFHSSRIAKYSTCAAATQHFPPSPPLSPRISAWKPTA